MGMKQEVLHLQEFELFYLQELDWFLLFLKDY